MDIRDVAIATITWVRSADDEPLLRRTLDVLARTRLPIAVADRGTSASFADHLRDVAAARVTTTAAAGLVGQVQESFRLAAAFGTPFILYVEPDKDAFFQHHLTEFVRQAPDGADVGIVLAARSDRSFATFPPMQRYTEGVINHLCEASVGHRGDYSYGPFIMSRAFLQHVSTLGAHLGWGWRHATFLAAARSSYRVVHIVGDYCCPPHQRREDEAERIHRMRQLSENILGLTT
jgi:hypothetical protein